MDPLALPIVLGLIALSLSNWRAGILCAVSVGFAQDVLRKATPGEPVHLVLLAVVVFGLAAAGAVSRGMPLSLRPLTRIHPHLHFPLTAWVVLVLLQCGHTLVKTGSVYLAAIGMIAYLLPVFTLVVAFHFGSRTQDMRRLLTAYVALAAVMGSGVYLEVFGFDWALLKPVGEGLYIYPTYFSELRLPQGFYRTPEVAAWHMTTALCMLSVLVLSRSWRYSIVTAVLLCLFLLFAVLFTGRRKMVVELFVFAALYGTFAVLLKAGAARLGRFVALAAVATTITIFLLSDDVGESVSARFDRTTVSVSEIVDRLRLMTTKTFGSIVQHNGFFGSGAGTGSQGAQHFGGGVALVGGAAEGGIGKLVAELGIPGLAVSILLLYALARSFRELLRPGSTHREHMLRSGLIAFLAVQFPVFAGAAQIYGDPFVLLVLGLLIGIVLASPQRTLADLGTAARDVGGIPIGPRHGRWGVMTHRRGTPATDGIEQNHGTMAPGTRPWG